MRGDPPGIDAFPSVLGMIADDAIREGVGCCLFLVVWRIAVIGVLSLCPGVVIGAEGM